MCWYSDLMKRLRSYLASGQSPTQNVRRQTQVAPLQLCLGVLLVLGLLPRCLLGAGDRASQSDAREYRARSTREPHPDRRLALLRFRKNYNEQWTIQRLGYQTPLQARRNTCSPPQRVA
jgi:hypothetical protein